MKHLLLTSAAVLTTSLAIPTAAQAVILYTAGDLLLGFQATGGTGANSTYVFNLGPATQFRDALGTVNVTSQPGFSTLGADLTATFGPGWFTRTDLFWGAAAVRSSAPFGAPVDGDPTRTVYASIAAGGPAWTAIGQTDRSSAANDMAGFQVAFAANDGTAASSNRGAVIPVSTINDWSEYNTRNATGPTEPSFNAFNPTIETAVGNGLDLYRILNTSTGANPGGTPGNGSFEGTFTNSPTGAVTFAIPEPSTAAIVCIGSALLGLSRRRRAIPSES